MRKRLDDQLVKALPAPARGASITYDAALPGFGVRVTSTGSRSFVLNYRIHGRERRYTIGGAEAWKTTAARKVAADLKARIRLGEDPLEEIERRRSAPTVADLCDDFIELHLPRLRPKSQALYRGVIEGTARRKGIRAYLGRTRVSELRHADVEDLHRYVSKTAPTMANRTIAVMSKMLGLAVRWGWRDDNPAQGVERNRENCRQRYLAPAEIADLSAALGALEDAQAANVLRLLLLTGCRRGEAMSARWSDLDLERGIWTKPGATTKQKTEHRVPLSAAAVQLLESIDRAGPWVFPSRVGDGHRVEIRAAWRQVCRSAGLVGDRAVRMHDLRHTYASVLASAGLSLPVIGALLGHTQPATTARYAHLLDDPLRAATERAAAVVTGAAPAEVIRLDRIPKQISGD